MEKRGRFLFLFLIVGSVIWSACQVQDKEADAVIARTERLRQLDELCKAVQTPTTFVQSEKRLSGNAVSDLIIYRYRSNETFHETYEFFSDWFEQNEWTFDGPADENLMIENRYFQYHKNGITVSVEGVPFANAEYSVSCSRKK